MGAIDRMRSTDTSASTRRRLLATVAAGVAALAAGAALLDVEVLGMAGLSLLMLLSLAATAIAARELDQDVIYLAGLGALVGAAHARLAGGAGLSVAAAGETWSLAINALAGGMVGAAAGDVARAGKTRTPRGALARMLAADWLSDRRGLARWLKGIGWLTAAVSLAVIGVLIVMANRPGVVARYSSDLLPNFEKYLEQVETYPGAWETMGQSLVRVWYAYALLLPVLAVCLNLPLRRQAELEADRLLSRVALAHCLTLAFLGGRLLLAALSGMAHLSSGELSPERPYGEFAEVVAAIRDIQPPLIVLLVTIVLLGRWRLRYFTRFAWMPAIGAAMLAACGLAAFGAVFLANAQPA
jgi:hypothetical protein